MDLQTIILPARLETYARQEHVRVIDHSIQVIKERTLATYADLPYKCYPKLMIVELVSVVVHMMNFFTVNNDLNSVNSPDMIIEGQNKLDLKQKRINYGAYAIVHDKTNK